MKLQFPFRSPPARLVLLLFALSWTSAASRVFAADAIASRSVADPRAAQANELGALREEYAARARQPGADQAKLLAEYNAKCDAIRKKFLVADTRAAEIQDIKDRYKGEIDSTGSNPKDVRADVDLAARNEQVARTLADEWRAKGDVVTETPTKFVNQTRDATLWKPETPEVRQAKVEDLDAFSTEGGQQGTGNKSAVRDELGWQIDNEKKFIHAQQDGDLKTGSKSVDKAAGASDVRAQNPDFYKKAEILRQYGDDVQAGITDLADTPEVRKQKLDAWREEARIEMEKSRAVAERRSVLRDDVRESFQQALEDATPADPANRDANFRDSATIGNERTRVRESNLAADRMNETLRAESGGGTQPGANTTIEAGGKGPTVREGTTTRVGQPAPDAVTTIKPGEAGPIARNTTIGQLSPQAGESVGGSVPDLSGVGEVVHVEPPGSLRSSGGSSGGRPSLQQFAPQIDPSQVQMPHLAPGEKPTVWVTGDAQLADLANPNVRHMQAPPPDPDLAALVRGDYNKPPSGSGGSRVGPAGERTTLSTGSQGPNLGEGTPTTVKGGTDTQLSPGSTGPNMGEGAPTRLQPADTRLSSGSTGPSMGEGAPTRLQPADTRLSAGSSGPNLGEGSSTRLQSASPAQTTIEPGGSGPRALDGTTTRVGGPAANTTIEPGGTGPRASSGTKTVMGEAAPAGGGGQGFQAVDINKFTPKIDPSQVQFPPRVDPTTKYVSGDPALADLAEPGVRHIQRTTPVGDPRLAELVKGGGKPAASAGSGQKIQAVDINKFAPQIDPSQVQMPGRAQPPTTRAVSGDPALADLAEPGVRHIQRTTPVGDPQLAELVKGGKPRGGGGGAGASAETVIGGEGSGGVRAGEGAPTKIGQSRTTISPDGSGGPNMGEGGPTKVREGGGPPSEPAGPKVEGPRIRKILNVANEVVGGVALAGQFGEAGTKQAGDVIDENRDFTVGDAGEALWEGSGIPSMFQMGRDVSTEEQIRVQKGEQGQAAALGRTYVRMADKMAHEMINDPVDRAIAEEEARAAAAGEEPDYVSSSYNAATDIGGKFTGLGALANAVEETTTWDERADYAAQRGAMGQFVDENVGRSSTRIRKLQGEIEQLSLNGDMENPETVGQIQRRVAEMDAEYDKLNKVSGMAERTLGQDTAQSVNQQIASLPNRDDFKGYIGQTVGSRADVRIEGLQPSRDGGATAVLDTGEPAPRDLSPADQQGLANESSAASQTTFGSPQRAGSGGLLDTLSGIGQKVKDEVENQVIKNVIENPQPYVRGALQGLNAESDDSRRIRQMYNSAPEGSDDRKQLNGLFEQLRDARTPEQRAAAQTQIEQWSDKYPPSSQLPPTTPNELVLPTKDELLTDRDQSADRIRQHDQYIQQLQQSGGSKEDIESAQWIREQEQQRLNGINQSLSGGEFQQPAAPTDQSAPSSPATTVSAITPAVAAPEETPPEPDEQRSPGGWTADQLQNDNYNMQNLAEDAQGRIENLEQQIADSHNSTEKQELQNQIDRERAELGNLQTRIDGNNAELTAMGAETGDGVKPPPSPWTAEQLQNDNSAMQNLAGDTQDKIKNLEQQIAESHNGSERRDLQEQLDRERAELGGLQDRIDNNNAALVDMGAEPGTGEEVEIGPWSAEQLENDNSAMQNLVDRTQGRIDDLEQRIRDSRDGSERRDLQEQLDREQAEMNGLQERIDGNNEQLDAMAGAGGGQEVTDDAERDDGAADDVAAEEGGGQEQSDDAEEDDESTDTAAAAGSSVFGTGADSSDDEVDADSGDDEASAETSSGEGEPSDEDDLAANEPDYNEGADGLTPPEVDPDTDGGIQQYVEANDEDLPGLDDYDIVRTSTEGQQAETASDSEVDNAANIRNEGGAEAQQTVDQSTSETAGCDRDNSWGNVLGNAVQEGAVEGGQALGTAFAGTGADHVSGQVFGPAPPTNSTTGNAEGNENGDDAGQGDAVASGSSPSVPPPGPVTPPAPPPQTAVPPPSPPAPSSGYGNCPRCNIPFIKCSDGVWRCPNSGWVRQNGGAAAQTPPAPAPAAPAAPAATQPARAPDPTYGPML